MLDLFLTLICRLNFQLDLKHVSMSYDLDSQMVLVIISRFVLLTSLKYCGWALVGEVGPCWYWVPTTFWIALL